MVQNFQGNVQKPRPSEFAVSGTGTCFRHVAKVMLRVHRGHEHETKELAE
jgi:hypothetical protein